VPACNATHAACPALFATARPSVRHHAEPAPCREPFQSKDADVTPAVDSARPDIPAEVAVPRPLPAAVEHFAALQRHADALAPAASLPRHLRGSPADVLLVLRAADDLRLPFIAAVQGLHIVEGKLAMSAELMRALAFGAGHEFWFERSDDNGATACIKRRGSQRVHSATFTMDDARRAGLTGRDNWKKYPASMCAARATSMVARRAIPDVLAGVGHTPEELSDDPTYAALDVPAEIDSGTPAEAKGEAGPQPQPVPQPQPTGKPERATSQQYEQIEQLLAQLPEDRALEVIARMKAALRIDSLDDLTRDMADQAIPRLRGNVEAERARTPEEPAHTRLAHVLDQTNADIVRQAWRNRVEGSAEPSSPATQARFKAAVSRAGLRPPVLAAGLWALYGVTSAAELSEVELVMLTDQLEASPDTVERLCEASAQAHHHPVETARS